MKQEEPVVKTEKLKLTPVSEIKKRANVIMREGELVELPSGIVVRLARPSLAAMIKSGKIPDHLVSAAVKQLQGGQTLSAKEVRESIDVMEEVMMLGFVEPKLVRENPQEGEITFDDLSDDDRGFAYSYIQFGRTNSQGGLKSFRSKRR